MKVKEGTAQANIPTGTQPLFGAAGDVKSHLCNGNTSVGVNCVKWSDGKIPLKLLFYLTPSNYSSCFDIPQIALLMSTKWLQAATASRCFTHRSAGEMFMAQCVESSIWCVNVRNNHLLSLESKCTNTGAENVTQATKELLYHRACKSLCKRPMTASVMVWKSHHSSLVMLCTTPDLWIPIGSLVLPLALATALMVGRWTRDNWGWQHLADQASLLVEKSSYKGWWCTLGAS